MMNSRKMYTVIAIVLVAIYILFLVNLYYEDNRKINIRNEATRIINEGITSDEIYIVKSISPEFNYYELYMPDYVEDGRVCAIQNVNDGDIVVLNEYLNTDPSVANKQ